MPPLRYVILHHTGVSQPHFDIMVETEPGGPLRTWRSAVWPITERPAVVALVDHRAVYLDYEGPVSGGRGEVKRVERGTCEFTPAVNGFMLTLPTSQRLFIGNAGFIDQEQPPSRWL